VLFLAIAFLAETYENKYLLGVFLVTITGCFGYLIYEATDYNYNKSLRFIFYLIFTTILAVLTTAQGIIRFAQYGKGLRAHLLQYSYENEQRNSLGRRSRKSSIGRPLTEINSERWSLE